MKQNYIAPKVKNIMVQNEGLILAGSDTGPTSSGENLTQDNEYNPW